MTKCANSSHPTLREQVNSRLRAEGHSDRVTNSEWRRYRDEGWPPDLIATRISSDRRNGRSISTEPEHHTVTADPELAAWVTARTLLTARTADADPRVIAWRERHLPDGQLLTTEQVPEWVTEQAAATGSASRFAAVQVPAGWRPGEPIPTEGQQVSVSVRSLPYVKGSVRRGERYVGGNVHQVGTVTGTALDHLREVSEHLAATHGWVTATATMYVLTGIAPAPRLLTVGVEHRMVKAEAGRQRITVTADPDIPADVVAAAFRAERVKLRGPRARLPQAKLSRLAAHMAQHRTTGPSMKQLRDWWNAEQPADRYSDVRAFRQAARDAERRVLGQPRPRR